MNVANELVPGNLCSVSRYCFENFALGDKIFYAPNPNFNPNFMLLLSSIVGKSLTKLPLSLDQYFSQYFF